ncbi:MAG TPA: deoxyribonuclease IV, partial [Candidatus Limnocylindrales bacterium]|nr:deoxyribonuclease IV [Candidatus Limnocylindrales bacterium]
MLPNGRRLGAHLPLAKGLVRAAEHARELGASAMQVFTDNPSAWRRRASPPAELPAFRARLAELDIRPLAVHAAYLVNIAGARPELYERSIEVLGHELRIAPEWGAAYVNVHVGSHLGAGVQTGLERAGAAIARALASAPGGPDAARLVLESSAGGGQGLGATIEELAALLDSAVAHGADPDRIRFCLDTAHLWAAGYPIAEPEEVDRVVRRFDELIGLDRLVLVH